MAATQIVERWSYCVHTHPETFHREGKKSARLAANHAMLRLGDPKSGTETALMESCREGAMNY
jgi:hypothetical protein